MRKEDTPGEIVTAFVYLGYRDHETGEWLTEEQLAERPDNAKAKRRVRALLASGKLDALDLAPDARRFLVGFGA